MKKRAFRYVRVMESFFSNTGLFLIILVNFFDVIVDFTSNGSIKRFDQCVV